MRLIATFNVICLTVKARLADAITALIVDIAFVPRSPAAELFRFEHHLCVRALRLTLCG
ncbi:MAG: hypothetical protein R3C09_05405 [Pirellulaceae bacterium]